MVEFALEIKMMFKSVLLCIKQSGILAPLGKEMNLSNSIIGAIIELARGCIAVCHQCGVDVCLTYRDTKRMANESSLKLDGLILWLDAEEFDGYFEERLGKSQSIFYCKECIPALPSL